MAEVQAADPPPTIAEIEEGVSLLRKIRHYERMGVRMLVVSPGDPIRFRPVGAAVDLVVDHTFVFPTQ